MIVFGKELKDMTKKELRWLTLRMLDYSYAVRWGKNYDVLALSGPVPKSLM